MEVELIELYRNGHKIPREKWRQQRRYRGELRVSKYFSWWDTDRAPACATLHPLGVIEDLHRVRILHFQGQNLVLMGDQSVAGATFDQIWWCKLCGAQPWPKPAPRSARSGQHGVSAESVSLVEFIFGRWDEQLPGFSF